MLDEHPYIRGGKTPQIAESFFVCTKLKNASWLQAICLSDA